ncbi:MAG: YkgJ family cysteine cluster protein [Planctomycetes bacterium]|nr:YkgJ family cysteine cluster protein [Planctomycetota bacterium]
MHDLPWYHAGLRFSCARCGHCCTGEPGNVWLAREEIGPLAAHLGLAREEFLSRHTRVVEHKVSLVESASGDCMFYDRARGCTVHDLKPLQCRVFPFWPHYTQSEFHWGKLRHSCRGVNSGRRWSAEEITRLANSYDLGAARYRAAEVVRA